MELTTEDGTAIEVPSSDVVHRWIDRTLAGYPADQLPYADKPRTLEPATRRE